MIYLILTFISLLILFFMIYLVLNFYFSTFQNKQNFYKSVDQNGNFILLYLVKCSSIFVPVLKFIRIKIFIDYLNKLDNMLKIFDFREININAYNFIFIQIVSMFIGCIISILLFGIDLLFIICFGGLFLILPYLKIYEQYNKKIMKL